MSTYMKALRRLEHDGQIAPAAAPRRRRAAREADEAAARPVAPAAAASSGVEELLDRLRALAVPGAAARVLVFAPVEAANAARGVVESLAARAGELRLPLAVAELTRAGGAARLAPRSGEARPLDLDGPGLAGALREWADAAAASLALVVAPPLLRSIDAALLGAAGDGLVLVAETGATTRAALRAAAARARAGGCRTLGVVLTRPDEG